MTSHGVARTARTRTEEQRQQDREKIQKYRSLEDQIAQSNYSEDTFALTSKLLRLNPEYYTIWNARRRCLTSGLLSKPSAGSSPSRASPNTSATAIPTSSSAASSPSSSTAIPPAPDSRIAGKSGTTPEDAEAQDAQTLRTELAFTIPLLMQFPKCYWIWNYRRWILQQAIDRLSVTLARRIWMEELGLVSKMLDKDYRNFHAWGYRRHVVAILESAELNGSSMVESEFEYTTRMIRQDLSNFSAWHNRSQLIPRLLDERKADDAARKELLEQEINLIRSAFDVGPEDQSLWYYHQYLILNLTQREDGKTFVPHLTTEVRKAIITDELDAIKDLLEDFDDVKWIYEALIEYTVALSQMLGEELGNQEREDVAEWLTNLKRLDPKRSGRWKDLEKDLGI